MSEDNNIYSSAYESRQEEEAPKTGGLPFRFSDVWKGFLKFWWIIIVLAVIGGGGMYYRSYRSYREKYSVSATFTVNTQALSLSGEGLPSYSYIYDSTTATQLEDTFPYILSSNILTEAICEDIGMSYIPASLTANAVASTNMFTLTAVGYDPQQTYDVLCSAMKNYPSAAKYLVGNVMLTVITEPFVPTEPVNEFNYDSLYKGLLYGAVLGIAWIFVYALFRKTIKTKSDIKEKLKLAVVGTMPEVTFKKYRNLEVDRRIVITNNKIGSGFQESVRVLKNSIVHLLGEAEKTIMFTSTAPGEGKTTATINAAAALCDDGYRVLVIDADLRNPSIAEALVLETEANFDDGSLYRIESKIDNGYSFLRFNTEDSVYAKIMDVDYLSDLLPKLAKHYDYILVDTPPCGLVSDAITIAQCCDALVYVVLQDTVRVNKITAGINLLMPSGIHILGAVLNGARSGLAGYGDNYGYGYGSYGHYKSYSRYGYGYGRGYGYGSRYGEDRGERRHGKRKDRSSGVSADEEK